MYIFLCWNNRFAVFRTNNNRVVVHLDDLRSANVVHESPSCEFFCSTPRLRANLWSPKTSSANFCRVCESGVDCLVIADKSSVDQTRMSVKCEVGFILVGNSDVNYVLLGLHNDQSTKSL